MALRVLQAVAAVAVLCRFPVTLTRAGDRSEGTPGKSYVAAVYEHRVILNPEPHVPLSRDAALKHMMSNLDVYEEQAARAAEQGAQIIVFPEDGLQGFNFSRLSISAYLETIPDPQSEDWNPCTQTDRHTHTEVCTEPDPERITQSYTWSHPTCPPDGRWQFNTDVVFRWDGSLAARYHKHNLYFEKAFDAPPTLEVVTFDTPFAGRFGVFTCFDILFHDPTVRLLEQGVRQMVYPTAWMNQLPLLSAVQFQRAFSLGANTTLLAANIRADSLGMTGSGIFTPGTAIYHHARAGQPEEGRLLVLRIPVLDTAWLGTETRAKGQAGGEEGEAGGETARGEGEGEAGGQTARGEGKAGGETAYTRSPKPLSGQREGNSGFCLQESQHCREDSLSTSPPAFSPSSPFPFTSSMMYDPFSFLLLSGSEGQLTVCDGRFCCHLQYRRSPQGGNTELYALGAFSGTHTVNGRYNVQVCALVRCLGSEVSSCGQEVEEAESRVDFLLEGKFGTRHVYPSLLGSGMVLEQPDQVKTTADGRVAMEHSGMSVGLVTACLYGRVYDQD
ncbi:biotinidase-like [Oncorhynchus keta]|uniref:biotinidase-like n=1 Tax=Oncorhynchus keta TaxID=8018 RepID=UPI00227A80E9|nr:biotinidase-like [Oncorhynchus keta]